MQNSRLKSKFNDQTILSTPKPIHSSSMTEDGKGSKTLDLDDIPERLNDSNNSLGILSVKSDDIDLSNLLDPTLFLKSQRESAQAYLKQYETQHSQLTSLPSRFLRPCDVSDNLSGNFAHSESTISESDLLLHGNSSTPRESMVAQLAMKSRVSIGLGQSIACLGSSLKNPNFNLGDMTTEFSKIIGAETSFKSGEEALAKLEQDEKSWRNRADIPAPMSEFSVSCLDMKQSMGSFFKERSDDLPQLFGKSPKKSQPPVPLIETTITSQSFDCDNVKSINVSDIQKLLEDQDTNLAIDVLMNCGKKSQSPDRSQSTFQESKTSMIKYDNGKVKDRTSISRRSSDKLSIQSNHVERQPSVHFEDEDRFSEASKENISPEIKSILSSRSSSSLSSLPNGKLPIGTTKSEILWGCIKPGRSNSQTFIVINRTSNRVPIQCSVSNPSFRLNRDGLELNYSSTLKVILHPYESRVVSVTFAPTTIGAAVDYLQFTSADPNLKQTTKQYIKLFGYGGYGKIVIQKIIKDTTGRFLLCLGNIDEQRQLKRTFMVQNSGSLVSFVNFEFINGLYSFPSVQVYPQTAVLLPGEEREITVTCTLLRKHIAYIKSKINKCVVDFGKLRTVTGTEVDRARLRKVCQKAKEKGMQLSSYSSNLIMKFPGEVVPTDVKYFKESVASTEEVLRLLNYDEMTVTLEQGVDNTLLEQLQDETVMFESFCENTNLEPTAEGCHVEPTRLILTPPDKIKDRIFLTNNTQKSLYYEVNCTPEGLVFNPKDGMVDPGETLIIDLKYVESCKKTVFKVRILVDNESFEVDVKIVFVIKRA